MSKFYTLIVVLILAGSAQAQVLRSIGDYEKRGAQRYIQNDYDGAISDFTMVRRDRGPAAQWLVSPE